mmetsp:Transcript_25426/g.55933  ORF Transcript_25426/g.55933 Transcript_25426/m.55933 type:complete len:161 (+) Transcript_25426:68-550(+)
MALTLVFENSFLGLREIKQDRRRARSEEPRPVMIVEYDCASVCDVECEKATSEVSTTDTEVEYTTIMLRHIPNRVREEGLCAFLDGRGFSNTYDIVVLPCDAKTKRNRGYGFVNFVRHEDFLRAMGELGGLQVDAKQSKKITQVSVADEQLGSKRCVGLQ